MPRMEINAIYTSCVEQLGDFAKNAGFTDCVLGLSGGLDSSVAAPLCVAAFGAKHVHGVLMPGPYSTEHSIEDAQELACALGIDTHIISITEPYEAFADLMAPACGGTFDGLASENTQARCRMIVLMALSNQYGWMVVNTGNRTEAYMGYSTLYGDTAGAFAPLGGLWKKQVYDLGRYINKHAIKQATTAPIPDRVFKKPPSAELAPDQTDEAGLGIDYPTLDAILSAAFDRDKAEHQLIAEGFDRDKISFVLDRVKRNAFKRAYLPPAAKI